MNRESFRKAVDRLRAVALGLVGRLLLTAWSRTIRIRFVNREVPDRLYREGKNFLYAFWHGRQFLLFHAHRGEPLVVPASESRDGEIQARILQGMGFSIVRGSSKRKGERALLGLVDALRKGRPIALAVDGPRGPLHEVKQGVTYLAGKLGKPIIPLTSSAKRYWILGKIWDKYLLPAPFTKGVVVYGDPIEVHGTAEAELEGKRNELAAAINRIMNEADAYFTDAGNG